MADKKISELYLSTSKHVDDVFVVVDQSGETKKQKRSDFIVPNKMICQTIQIDKFAFGANGNGNFFGVPNTASASPYFQDLLQSNHLLITPSQNTYKAQLMHDCVLDDIVLSTPFPSDCEIAIWKSSNPLGYDGTNATLLYHTQGTLICRKVLNLSCNANDYIHLAFKSRGSVRVFPQGFLINFKYR